MIGVLEVKISAHAPNMALCPCFTFKGSPSSLRIMGCPKQIGQWRITDVYATFHYPDDSEKTKLSVREGNIYVATVDGCQTTGKVENGLTISANGIDENGNAVTGYVLGRGDIYVMEGDSVVPDPTTVKNYVKLCDSLPDTPVKGDAYFQNGVLVIYDGTNWVPSADVHGDYIEDENGNKIEADRTFTWREKSSWYVSELNGGTYTYDPPLECAWGTYTIDNGQSQTQTQMWMSKTPYAHNEYFGIGANLNYVEYYDKVGETFVALTGDMIEEHTDNSITVIGMESCSITRTGEWSDRTATLATLADIPTKTSDLTNDSGFITAAQVPTPDKIEDLSANVIYANRNVQYIEEIANWTDADYPDDPLNWEADNNWWIAYVSSSFYMKLQFNSGTWTLETGENMGGEWFIDSDSVQDTQEATELTFSISGAAYVLTKGVQQIQTTGELALKSYVDGIVGDINSVLDTINGEVI